MSVILGIESTAHTFGVSVVRKGKVLSNVRDSYTTSHGGIIPIEAAKHHSKVKEQVYKDALKVADINESGINAIAFSQGPGLASCLLEGLRFVKQLAVKLNVPLVPVNHCVAHLEIGRITGAKDPVLIYASGANTQIIAYASGKYRVFGETLDTGVGNFIDTFARFAGMGFPGGPAIQKLAEQANKENYIELPYSVKGMDISFSGILTNLRQKLETKKYSLNDLAFSLQETVFAMLVEVSERALAHINKKELVLGGGVACNKRLQEMCKIMCKERGAKFFVPANEFLVDNGAMIAFLGEIIFESIKTSKNIKSDSTKSKLIYYPKDLDELDILPRQRTDQVNVTWR